MNDAVTDEDGVMASLPHGDAIAMPGEARALDVVAPDGVRLAAQSWGDPSKPAIVFVHGFAQSHLSWLRQVRSDLAHDFHLVTYDLRGHGASDKPMERSRYDEARIWADDLAAVMDAAEASRVVLVAWSFGGRSAFNFLAVHGESRVAGLNLVGASATSRADLRGTGSGPLRPLMRSADLSKNIVGTREFLRRCFFHQPPQQDFEEMLAYNMVTPPAIRPMMLEHAGPPDEAIAALRLPVLVTYGLEDALVLESAARFSASLLPNGTLSLYEAVGHAPFYEAARRFNAELKEFAAHAFAKRD